LFAIGSIALTFSTGIDPSTVPGGSTFLLAAAPSANPRLTAYTLARLNALVGRPKRTKPLIRSPRTALRGLGITLKKTGRAKNGTTCWPSRLSNGVSLIAQDLGVGNAGIVMLLAYVHDDKPRFSTVELVRAARALAELRRIPGPTL